MSHIDKSSNVYEIIYESGDDKIGFLELNFSDTMKRGSTMKASTFVDSQSIEMENVEKRRGTQKIDT